MSLKAYNKVREGYWYLIGMQVGRTPSNPELSEKGSIYVQLTDLASKKESVISGGDRYIPSFNVF